MIRPLLLATLMSTLALGQVQTITIPHIADGAGWQTTLVLTNTSASATTVNLAFFQDIGGGGTQDWRPSFLEVSSTQNLPMTAAGTLILHTTGTNSTATVGWAQLQANASIMAYAIFSSRIPGRQTQQGTAEASDGATRLLVPFDNTNGNVMGIALANPTAAGETIAVGLQPSAGPSSQLTPISLPAQGHTSFVLAAQFPTTTGQSGQLEFYSANGNFAGLALTFNSTGGFSTSPVYPERGDPIIVSGGSAPSGIGLSQFVDISMVPDYPTKNSLLTQLGIGVIDVSCLFLDTNGNYKCTGVLSSLALGSGSAVPELTLYAAIWNSVVESGNTLTFGDLDPMRNAMYDLYGNSTPITSASLTVTLAPPSVSTDAMTLGPMSGSLTLVGKFATVSGSFTGKYTAIKRL